MPQIIPAVYKLPASTQWGAHGNGVVSPTLPADFGWKLVPGPVPSWLFWAQGNPDPAGKLYPGVEFYPCVPGSNKAMALPELPNTGHAELKFTATTNGAENVLETDFLRVYKGTKGNGSLQRHRTTGQIDVGNWTPSNIIAGPWVPSVPHPVSIKYGFTDRTFSVQRYACDDFEYENTVLQDAATEPTNWAPEGLYGQFQIGLTPAAPLCVVVITNPRVVWF